MDSELKHKSKNNINRRCIYLVNEKHTHYYQNSRGKTTTMLIPYYKCLKKQKEVITSYDCVDCQYYHNLTEIIEQQALHLKEMALELEDLKDDFNFFKERIDEVLAEYDIDAEIFFKKVYSEVL